VSNIVPAAFSEFESGVSQWSVVGGAGSLFSSTSQANLGTHSMGLTSFTTADNTVSLNFGNLFTVLPLHSYAVSVKSRGDFSRWVVFAIDWYTAGGGYISTDVIGQGFNATGAWTTYSNPTVTTPAGAALCDPKFQVLAPSTSGATYFDTLVLDDGVAAIGALSYAALLATPAPRASGQYIAHDIDVLDQKLVVEIASPSVQVPSLWSNAATFGDPGANFDVGVWDGLDYGQWIDVSDRCRGLQWNRGSRDAITAPEVGTATVDLYNLDGLLSPWATSGAFTNSTSRDEFWDVNYWDDNAGSQQASWLLPGTLMRFGVTDNTGDYDPLFTGLIETITESSVLTADAWVSFGLVDTLATLGAYDGPQQSPVGTSDTLALRVARLLTDAGWAYGSTVGSPGVPAATLQATTLANNRLTELKLTADSTFSELIAGANGKAVVNSIATTGGNFLSLYLSNSPLDAETPVVDIKPYSSTDRLINKVTAAIVGSTQRTTSDLDSVNKFGVQANVGGFPRSDLILENDTQVDVLLAAVLRAHSADYFGIESIDLDADMAPRTLYGQLSQIAARALEGRLQVQVRWVHPNGQQLNLPFRVAGFNHSITMQGGRAKWTATLRLASV
jgi:hypothetical protein